MRRLPIENLGVCSDATFLYSGSTFGETVQIVENSSLIRVRSKYHREILEQKQLLWY